MAKPKISIIVATYNSEKYLKDCLDSLIGQTFTEIEIICIDDCSSDKSLQILEKYSTKDKRIKVLRHEENLGQAAARNFGISHAQGKYIMFCDSDDYYHQNMCAKMYQAIESYNVDVAACGIEVIYHTEQHMHSTDQEYYRIKFYGRHFINDEVIRKIDMAPTNKIFRRSEIERINLEFPHGLRFEDAYFVVCYLAASRSIYFIDDKLYFYIRHSNSTMSGVWSENIEQDYASDHLEIAIKIYDFLEAHQLLERYNKLYWILFAEYFAFAVNLSKTPTKRKIVRSRAKTFIAAHIDSFRCGDKLIRRDIKHARDTYRHPIGRIRGLCNHIINKFRPLRKLQCWSIATLARINSDQQCLKAKINHIEELIND